MQDNSPTTAVISLEARITYQCLLIATRITRLIEPMLADEYDLTAVNWRVLAVVGRYGPLSAKEVAQYTSTDAFFVSRSIVQLVKKGYMTRDVDDRDRRRSVLQLTKKGDVVKQEIEAVLSSIENELLRGLSAQERVNLRLTLQELSAVASTWLGPPLTWRDF